MKLPSAIRAMLRDIVPAGRRVIAFLLLSLVTFLVVNPVWECQDHLDNLRHLGPHGVLIILLTAAVAALPLLKTAGLLLACLFSATALWAECVAILRSAAVEAARPAAPLTGPPLRI